NCGPIGWAAAAETQPIGPQFVIEIPKEGIAEDEQHEVNLQAGDKLQIVDKTKSAAVQPENFSAEAYVYDPNKGTCDTGRNLVYEKAFSLAPPGYTFWATTNARSRALEDSTYTFTAPAAEQLQGSVSFCLELEVKKGSGTSVKPPSGLASFRKRVHSTKLTTPGRLQQASLHQTARHDRAASGRPSLLAAGPAQASEEKKKIVVVVHSGGSSFFLSGAVMISLLGSWFYNHA
ncbi:toxoplasma gondii family a protein, partial [Cystoisospora suis]